MKHTPLTQQDIIRHMREKYEVECERKAVSRNITALMEHGYEIGYRDGYYLMEREFDDSELRLLIDSVFFSPHIPPRQARALIEKLRRQASPGFGRTLNYVTSLSSLSSLHDRENKQFFYTLQTLDEAISEKCKVSMKINTYGLDMQLHPRRKEAYTVNPYRLVAANGRYYLIGNHDKHDDIAHIRIDRITDCRILEEKAKPMQLVKGLESGPNLPRYMAEHVYMRIGPSVKTRFRIPESDIGEVIDWFGKEVQITPDEKPGYAVVSASVNQYAMMHWAMQYLDLVEVLEPRELREAILEKLEDGVEKYQ